MSHYVSIFGATVGIWLAGAPRRLAEALPMAGPSCGTVVGTRDAQMNRIGINSLDYHIYMPYICHI